MYLLDSYAISDVMKGEVFTLNRLKSIPPALIYTSSITQMEISYGLLRRFDSSHKYYKVWQEFLKDITILTFDENAALVSAKIRTELEKMGKPIGAYDILIAGIAIEKNLILVTSNEKEFMRVNELKIENWRRV